MDISQKVRLLPGTATGILENNLTIISVESTESNPAKVVSKKSEFYNIG